MGFNVYISNVSLNYVATDDDAGAGEDSGGHMSSVIGISTGGSVGSSNMAHGSSSSAAVS